jgi:hypothetical protein
VTELAAVVLVHDDAVHLHRVYARLHAGSRALLGSDALEPCLAQAWFMRWGQGQGVSEA